MTTVKHSRGPHLVAASTGTDKDMDTNTAGAKKREATICTGRLLSLSTTVLTVGEVWIGVMIVPTDRPTDRLMNRCTGRFTNVLLAHGTL